MYPCGSATLVTSEHSLYKNTNRVLATINNVLRVTNALGRHVIVNIYETFGDYSVPAGALSSIFLDKRRSVELHLVDLCGRGRLGPLPFPLPLLLSWHCCCCCFNTSRHELKCRLSHQTEMRQNLS